MKISGSGLSSKSILLIVCLLFLASGIMAGVVYSQKTSSKTEKSPSTTPATQKAGSTTERSTSKTAPTAQALPRLVDVGADKCVPCVLMAPILEEVKKEYEGILQVDFVDAWKNPDEARKYGVRGIPTQIFYDASGKERGRHMGFLSKEGILKGFEELGIPLKKPPKK